MAIGMTIALRIAVVAFGDASDPTARPSSENGSDPSTSAPASHSHWPGSITSAPIAAAVAVIATRMPSE